jgi:hypothetical protein
MNWINKCQPVWSKITKRQQFSLLVNLALLTKSRVELYVHCVLCRLPMNDNVKSYNLRTLSIFQSKVLNVQIKFSLCDFLSFLFPSSQSFHNSPELWRGWIMMITLICSKVAANDYDLSSKSKWFPSPSFVHLPLTRVVLSFPSRYHYLYLFLFKFTFQ